jgi:hypothetical protein
MSDIVLASFISTLPALITILLAAGLVIAFRNDIRKAASGLAWRVKSGAHVKFASIELGETYISPERASQGALS